MYGVAFEGQGSTRNDSLDKNNTWLIRGNGFQKVGSITKVENWPGCKFWKLDKSGGGNVFEMFPWRKQGERWREIRRTWFSYYNKMSLISMGSLIPNSEGRVNRRIELIVYGG